MRDYREHLLERKENGALLVAVIGGKLSEGINFGDGLGRCVLVFGLPYPDLRNAEVRERLAHFNRMHCATAATCSWAQYSDSAGKSGDEACKALPSSSRQIGLDGLNQCIAISKQKLPSQRALNPVERQMYTNTCMQALNQCIGRAIRHAQDFAAVVLVDVRYTGVDPGSTQIRSKLPNWLTQRWVESGTSFGPAVAALAAFYRSM
jgi:chromosome transmission fidelity protein 1